MKLEGRSLARDALRDLAESQNGLITRQQALYQLNLTAASVDNLVARGRLERVAHGVYRYPHLPGVPEEPYQVALLRTGEPDAALSHETALQLHDLSDVNPARYHVTIPLPRRIRRQDNDRYVVHVQSLSASEVTWWQQMRIVTPATAIEQCISYGTPSYLLRQALDQSTRTGAVRGGDFATLTTLLEARR